MRVSCVCGASKSWVITLRPKSDVDGRQGDTQTVKREWRASTMLTSPIPPSSATVATMAAPSTSSSSLDARTSSPPSSTPTPSAYEKPTPLTDPHAYLALFKFNRKLPLCPRTGVSVSYADIGDPDGIPVLFVPPSGCSRWFAAPQGVSSRGNTRRAGTDSQIRLRLDMAFASSSSIGPGRARRQWCP